MSKTKRSKGKAPRSFRGKPRNVLSAKRGVMIVRLSPNHAQNFAPSSLRDIEGVAFLLTEYDIENVGRLIVSLSPGDLVAQEERWRTPPERSLSLYWRLDTRHLTTDRAQKLKAALEKLAAVDLAYVEPPATNPVYPSNDPLVKKQRYLNAAPTGIDAKWAWHQPGGTGQGVTIVDLEMGWHRHEDLPRFTSFPGVSREINGERDCKHGTMVLGILVAVDNRKGGVGITPDAQISVASHWRANPAGTPSPVSRGACSRPSNDDLGGFVSDTIVAVLPHLSPGDVLLLEVQRPFDLNGTTVDLPTELLDADLTAIQTAVNQGIVVIECGGNGLTDLDTVPELNPSDINFRDSGAIIIAGCKSKVSTKGRGAKKIRGHKPWVMKITGVSIGSNFGSRIDCHAWGERVATTGFDTTSGSIYVSGNHGFMGTSAAGPIVAGAAAAVQAVRKANGRNPLTPAQMAQVLRTTGTPQFPGPKKIGAMPDLKKAIPAALNRWP